jgi:WD40 repeat protein
VLVSAHESICVRDLATGELLRDPVGQSSSIHLMRVARWNGRDVVLTFHRNGRVNVWDLHTDELIVGGLTDWAGTRAVLPYGDTVLAVLEDHPYDEEAGDYDFDETALYVWDFYEGDRLCGPLIGGGVGSGVLYPPMTSVTLATGLALVSSAGGDRQVRVWDVAAGVRVGESLSPGDDDMKFTALAAIVVDGRAIVITGDNRGDMRAWDLTTGALTGEPIAAHQGRVGALTTTEVDGQTLVLSAGHDGSVHVWDCSAGTLVAAGTLYP